jgi:hypothetical protein
MRFNCFFVYIVYFFVLRLHVIVQCRRAKGVVRSEARQRAREQYICGTAEEFYRGISSLKTRILDEDLDDGGPQEIEEIDSKYHSIQLTRVTNGHIVGLNSMS